VSSPEQLPVNAGPVPDRLTIWPVDDGRYGLDATFQGATGYDRAEHHRLATERTPSNTHASVGRRLSSVLPGLLRASAWALLFTRAGRSGSSNNWSEAGETRDEPQGVALSCFDDAACMSSVG
jgi:hypothetical protein